jgi:hypothetical protein
MHECNPQLFALCGGTMVPSSHAVPAISESHDNQKEHLLSWPVGPVVTTRRFRPSGNGAIGAGANNTRPCSRESLIRLKRNACVGPTFWRIRRCRTVYGSQKRNGEDGRQQRGWVARLKSVIRVEIWFAVNFREFEWWMLIARPFLVACNKGSVGTIVTSASLPNSEPCR